MTTNQMKCFVSLYRTGSFTKAGELLYMTQPAISRSITALEEEIGQTLVERKKGGKIRFTEAGEMYYQSFQTVLNQLDDTQFRTKHTIQNKKRIIRIGTMETWFFPELIRLCERNLPEDMRDIEFIFEFCSPGMIDSRLENNQLDFVFTIEPAYSQKKDFVKEHITDIYTSLYTYADNPAVENGVINIQKLEPILYIINDRTLTHINMKKITELFYPRRPMIKEVLSGHSAAMNLFSGAGAAISDTWSVHQHMSVYTSMVLKQFPIPVILVRKSTNDCIYNQIGDYIIKTVKKWNTENYTE